MSKTMADREKKREEGNTKISVSPERKELLDEVKSIFRNF